MITRTSVAQAAATATTLPRPPRRALPRPGDIVASERSARADVYTVSVVPGDACVTVKRYAAALEKVQALARARRVDGWCTYDQTHFTRVANHRS